MGTPLPFRIYDNGWSLRKGGSEPQPLMQISKMQTTPAAESTRIPLRTSTEKREKSLSSEQLLDLEKSE